MLMLLKRKRWIFDEYGRQSTPDVLLPPTVEV